METENAGVLDGFVESAPQTWPPQTFRCCSKSLLESETAAMSFTIASLGRILASHAASGVSVSTPASQTLAKLTKGVHAGASQPANQTQFSAVFNGVRKAGDSSAATSQIEKS
jgi:hypothetical protein